MRYMQEKAFAVRGNICFSRDKKHIETMEMSYAVCEDGICTGVYRQLPEELSGIPVHDFGDRLVIPGLTDLHIHAPQYAYRGLGMDLELMDWLQVHAFPEEAKYADHEYADRAYGIFADRMRKSATTRACIFASRHREATEVLMDKMEASGLVSFVGKVNMDSEAPDIVREPGAESAAAETEKWLRNTMEKYENTKPIITPRFVPSCSRELFAHLSRLQTQFGAPVQSHISENLGEIKFVGELFPETQFYGQVYDKYDLFGLNHQNGKPVKTLMAHCVYSSDEELAMMKERDIFIAHCPASNINVCSGIAPVRKYLDMDMKMGVASDVAGGQTESLFRAITDTVQVSKLFWRMVDQNFKPLTFDEAFFLATKGGGEFFGNVGSFEAGYEFDAVVIDDSFLRHPQPLTVHDRLERAVYLAADINGICAKYVRGKRTV